MEITNIIRQHTAPSPAEHKYWADLNENPNGGAVKYWNGSEWQLINDATEILTEYLKKTDADKKYQVKLVSGTNIKTINGTTLLGSGDIVIPKGDKGDKGDTGAQGAKGEAGLSITAITLTKSADGAITGGKATMSDGSFIDITVSEAA